MKGVVPVNFILMANTIKTSTPENILKVFDLKGSTIDRNVQKNAEQKQTMKDMNLINCKKNRLRANMKGILQFKDDKYNNDLIKLRDIVRLDS